MGKTARGQKAERIDLKWDERENKVVLVTPQDNDKLVMSMEQAIEACRGYDPEQRARIQLAVNELFNLLGKWTSERGNVVKHAFLSIRDRTFLFLVVMAGEEYDSALEDDLTDLDLQIARNKTFSDLHLSVMAIPRCGPDGYESFLHPGFALAFGG